MYYSADVEQLRDFDMFFYYGLNELEHETKSDLFQNIIQPKRSLFYDRAYDAAGIPRYENRPNSLALLVNIPYDIVFSISKRNSIVSDGSLPGTQDRRIALSQATIKLEINNDKLKLNVLYIPLADYRQTDQLTADLNVQV
jgi:hypothetical protein